MNENMNEKNNAPVESEQESVHNMDVTGEIRARRSKI